ncbi:uncharacterized protein LOC131601973 [Vicia villosa]|uniref:uncharacterized protein LOC131601973 n=1 Tax=Vicia villosa TaxID=3911 RepID=UPI00273BA161|nr:uncharacterized protein LOC131601973 [Vicia villosa]
MSLQNKGFWMVKGSGHVSDREPVFDNPSKTEPKRSHQWLIDATEGDYLPNKKQAIEDANERSSSGFSNVNFTPWENNHNFNSVPNQFIDRLFGSETRPINFSEKNTYVSADDSNVRSNLISNHYGDGASFGLSISHSAEDSEPCMTFGGIKKVKINQVKDFDIVQAPEGHDFDRQSKSDLHQAYNGEIETRSGSIGQDFDKDGNAALLGLTYGRGDAHIRSFGTPFGKGDNTVLSMGESCNKEDKNIISFGGFPDERSDISVGRATTDYEQLYNQSSVHVSTTAYEKELDASNSGVVETTPSVATIKPESVTKNKQDIKRKESPTTFPTNVRSLISTGMLDGVPVKYVSVAREELRGIIKGSTYLCGCQSCNYSKGLNAYEFERHAGCKTKHPNNHIYFENGKTIYQIVQELRNSPESSLFDTIQTIFGAPINQKAFRIWKESFQAATRELQRIYGNERRNL